MPWLSACTKSLIVLYKVITRFTKM